MLATEPSSQPPTPDKLGEQNMVRVLFKSRIMFLYTFLYDFHTGLRLCERIQLGWN